MRQVISFFARRSLGPVAKGIAVSLDFSALFSSAAIASSSAGSQQQQGQQQEQQDQKKTQLPQDPPPIAPNYQAPLRPLPPSERVGVDVSNEAPLSLEVAIRLALVNNNDIDASRIDVQMAELDLKSARGVYDPRITTDMFYERATTPVTRAENTLKMLMLPDRTTPLWSRALLPTTDVNLDPPQVQLEQAVSAALANRPEIEQVETTAEINKINTRFFRDQTRPQIDLIGSYTAVGLAGTALDRTPNPLTSGNAALQERVNLLSGLAGLPLLPSPPPLGSLPDNLIGGFNQSFSNLFGLDFTTARFGVHFSLPTGNRTAEANLGRSLAEGRRIDNQRDQLKQNIEADVRNLLQAVRSAQARLNAAASARSSAEQQFESEQRRLQGGLSTVFLVLERQTEMISARGRELQAQTDLNRAIANFRRATGETLQVYNISVNGSGPGQGRHQPASIGVSQR